VARLSFGALLVPHGWDVQLQLELRAPPTDLGGVAPSLHKTHAPPVSNVVIRREAASGSAATCARALEGEMRASLPSLHVDGPTSTVFDDDAPGVALNIMFQSAEGIPVAQRHVFRMDDGVLTHLCATATDRAQLAAMQPLLMSFSP
jgi:hypothetical protein